VTDVDEQPSVTQVPATAAEAAELARRHGLVRIDRNPSLPEYLRRLWARRAFVVELATARAYARNQNNYLGQAWAALNPLLLAGSYLLIFGLLLKTNRGVGNFVGFLTIGIFIFAFIASTTTSGAKSIQSNQALVRGVRFPRAALPISVALSEILTLLPALVVLLILLPIPGISGEPIQVKWALLPGAVLLLFVFCSGVALIAARLVSAWRDATNVIPVAVRLLRYVSGVFFSITAYAGHGVISQVMQYQPVAVFLDLARSCLLVEYPLDPVLWAVGAGWAVVFLLVGIVVFWRAEQRYGHD